MFLINSKITAQNSYYKLAFRFQVGSFQYIGDYGNEMFDFAPFRLFQRFGISRYINSNFDVELISKWGNTRFRDDKSEKNLFYVGVMALSGLVSDKFLGDKNFRPYLKADLGLIKYNTLDNEPGQDASNFSVTLGLGFDYEFSKVASFGV